LSAKLWSIVLLFVLLTIFYVKAGERLEKAKNMALEYAKENFKDVEIIDVVKIPQSYEEKLSKDFNKVECKSKGKSSIYLYLDCTYLKDEEIVATIPITFRISATTKWTIVKNQKVSIVYLNKNIKIQMLGVALENGKEWDYIKVKNISTGKELVGKVISNDTVLIEANRE
jgi:flagella basal body P-ring formation protein FlgA